MAVVLTPEAREALADRLARHVQATKRTDSYVSECLDEAADLVTDYLSAAAKDVPTSVLNRAVIEVGADLFWRREARNGIMTFDGGGDAGIETARVSADPLRAARPLLDRWTGVPIA